MEQTTQKINSYLKYIDTIDKFAEEVESIAKKNNDKDLLTTAKEIKSIKEAQYLGIQGYWIKNTRCWGNCIRQKKSSAKDAPSYEVWHMCNKEYVDYINGKNNGWEKYASDNSGIKLNKDAIKIISKASNDFNYLFKTARANNHSIEKSFEISVDEVLSQYSCEIFNKISSINPEILKQAQARTGLPGALQGAWNWVSGGEGRQQQREIARLLGMFRQNADPKVYNTMVQLSQVNRQNPEVVINTLRNNYNKLLQQGKIVDQKDQAREQQANALANLSGKTQTPRAPQASVQAPERTPTQTAPVSQTARPQAAEMSFDQKLQNLIKNNINAREEIRDLNIDVDDFMKQYASLRSIVNKY